MLELFNTCDLPTAMFEDENWLSFATKLSQVLSDQPIINPTKKISEFCYVNAGNEGIMATINFTDERGSITLGGMVGEF